MSQKGNKNNNWRGGVLTKTNGYIIVYSPHHPYASKDKYVLKHRLIMEKKIKRFLKSCEVVHHINGIVNDNRIRNLKLFKDHSEHTKFENKFKFRNKKGRFKKGVKNGINGHDRRKKTITTTFITRGMAEI